MEELSDYERQRLEHIKRNHEFMVALGLVDASVDPLAHAVAQPKKSKAAPPRKKLKIPVPPESLRRSARVQGAAPDYTGERIDQFGEELDTEGGKKRKAAAAGLLGARAADDDEEDYEAAKTEMREEAMRFLQECREALLPLGFDAAAAADGDWRAEAVRRWGAHAGGGVAPAQRDWKLFVESRLSTPPPVSPLDFLQEYYAADTWRLLVSCVLMSRVSSWDTKHTCISAFFAKYPTPSAFADERDWASVKTAIHSLGLFDDRLRSLTSLTDAFLRGAPLAKNERADEFKVELDRKSPHKIHGVGPFGHDSFRVFCRDEGATIALSAGGEPVAPFVRWRRSVAVKAEAEIKAEA